MQIDIKLDENWINFTRDLCDYVACFREIIHRRWTTVTKTWSEFILSFVLIQLFRWTGYNRPPMSIYTLPHKMSTISANTSCRYYNFFQSIFRLNNVKKSNQNSITRIIIRSNYSPGFQFKYITTKHTVKLHHTWTLSISALPHYTEHFKTSFIRKENTKLMQ